MEYDNTMDHLSWKSTKSDVLLLHFTHLSKRAQVCELTWQITIVGTSKGRMSLKLLHCVKRLVKH